MVSTDVHSEFRVHPIFDPNSLLIINFLYAIDVEFLGVSKASFLRIYSDQSDSHALETASLQV